MTTIDLTTRSGSDRVLRLDIPVEDGDREYRVTVLIEPAGIQPPDSWPEGFFESTFGRWKGDFAIDSEGEYEERNPPSYH